MADDWNLRGTYFESCSCETLCPCIMLSPPTEGECRALVGWHVAEGRAGTLDLGGLNVAMAVHSPGPMYEVQWQIALYLDEQASDQQREALTRIFGGQAGGHFEQLAGHVGEVVGVRAMPIEYRVDGRTRTLRIANVAETEFEAIEGQGGREVTFDNHPLAVAPGHTTVVARARRLRLKDFGFDWQVSNKNAFYSDFAYEGP